MDQLLEEFMLTIEEITENSLDMFHDMKVCIGNKAAARRVRNNTLKLEKLFKKYRRISVDFEKIQKESA